ncbi:hypothetical protein C2857_001379 [Epichloe festucae Fl1]|uniref:HTH La-type RNA-binding domain-containing protein n=1 Tax=Epichloe festucae (strain Fl1) TaxID=877507 RepID=A0A7S9KRI8_EPIFF|nr:hypothetical protein C2857_001379 [Epichloe festucae Fl1]
MVSAVNSNSNEMAAASTFSYAQAAKGQGASPSITSPNPASNPQGTASPVVPETPVKLSEGPLGNESRPQPASEKQDVDSNIGSESDLRSETTHDRRSESRRDDDGGRLDRPWRRTDKGTRSSSTATRSVDEQESRRPRKGKKSKGSSDKSNDQPLGAEKTKEVAQETPKVELSEAPIPSVNIWLQRKEQQAKVTPVTTNGVTAHDNEAKKPTKESSAPPPTASKENAPANGVKSNRKTGDSGRSDRNGSRGSRLADKDSKSELPPSVEDAASWPTPEIAIKEDQKKPLVTKPVVAQEKESQDDGSQGKKQKEKWVTYDYVPSVSFETQLPQMRNSKPRGGARGANSGRTAPTSNQPSEKTAAASANANANANSNASKPNESKERTKESSTGSNRTNSLPPASKRASMDASNATKEQKKGALTGSDKTKDATSTPSSQQHQHTNNTRSEGRTERGRGGYRGRGAHHSVNAHSHQHNGANFSNNVSTSGRSQGPYSPPPRQGPHSQGFVPPPQRGGRGRNGAGNNFHRMSLPNGATRLPPIQATFGGSYEYPMHPMSAVPFQQPPQYWDNMVIGVLKNQIEYYFSIENLCKDMYLRKRMDSQGFVNLHFVAAFKRIRELTQDMAMIRAVCETSTEIDFVVGEDDIERLRRRNGWQSFILPMEDRDDFARNNGPSQLTFKNRPFNYGPHINGALPMAFGVPQMGFSPQGDVQFHHFPEGTSSFGQPVNGFVNGHSSTQLSADVPDFSPSGSAALGALGQDSAHTHTPNNTNGTALANGVHAE